jgi:hypothetical protein
LGTAAARHQHQNGRLVDHPFTGVQDEMRC